MGGLRKDFALSEAQYERLLAAAKPTPVMFLSGGEPMGSTQPENVNAAWRAVADELGFVWDTARASDKGKMFVSAVSA